MGVTCCNIKSIVKNAGFYHEIRWNVIKSITYTLLYDTYRHIYSYVTY